MKKAFAQIHAKVESFLLKPLPKDAEGALSAIRVASCYSWVGAVCGLQVACGVAFVSFIAIGVYSILIPLGLDFEVDTAHLCLVALGLALGIGVSASIVPLAFALFILWAITFTDDGPDIAKAQSEALAKLRAKGVVASRVQAKQTTSL